MIFFVAAQPGKGWPKAGRGGKERSLGKVDGTLAETLPLGSAFLHWRLL